MKPTELPAHLWPACRRVMLRHAAALARDLLDHADDTGLRVNRRMLETIERRALGELAAGADTIEKAKADLRILPPEVLAGLQTRPKLRVQLRQMSEIMRAHAGGGNTRGLVESAWRSLAGHVASFMDAAPPRAD